MRKKHVAVWLVCLSVVAPGCGSGGGVSDFCNSYHTAVDGYFVRCLGAPPDEVTALFQASDATECRNMAQAVTSKRAAYDSQAGQACLDEINGSTCADLTSLRRPDGPCAKAVTGTAAAGGSCYTDLDCSPADYCENVSGTHCPARCAAYVQSGGDCSQGQPCAGGLTCIGQTCRPVPTKGQACAGTCAAGLYCAGANGNMGTCKTTLAAGASCTSPPQCQLGLTCVSGKCVPVAKLGGRCSNDSDCGIFTWCSNGRCTAYPGVGGACGLQGNNSHVGCVSSWCKITGQASLAGTCTAYLKLGDACNANDYGSCGDAECDNGICTAACAEK